MGKPGASVILFVTILGAAGYPVSDSSAQRYPIKTIHLVVGYAPGGSADVTARMIAQKLSDYLGQPVIVENRAGASGAIANERVATAPADGYTLVMMTSSSTLQSAMGVKVAYDLERDLAPVSLAVVAPYLLVVHPSVPVRNAQELIALARANPGKLNYGSSGVGTTPFFAGEFFNLMAKSKIVHVPYKGGAEYAIATAAGQVDMSFPAVPSTLPLAQAGKVKILASTSMKRVSTLPAIPTLNESALPGYAVVGWIGILSPSGVPQDIIARLNAAIAKVVSAPDVKLALSKQGLEPQTNTPAQFAEFIRTDIAQTAKLVKLTGVHAE